MSVLIYLLQVSACIAIFYGFYYFMLNKLTFFTINRYYLLFTLLISFVIPLLTIPIHQQDTYPRVMQEVVYVHTLQSLPAYKPVAIHATKTVDDHSINWLQLLKWVYLLAVLALFTHLFIAFVKFFANLKKGKVARIGGVNILRGNKTLSNGSFLNYIFLNDDELSPEEMQQVIAHEMLHVKFYHSADRIIAKIIQIILWFNPFVYLYARSIEENHEFEVDREIARSTDKNDYAGLLLHLSVARHGMLYNSFSKVPLKKRITMLFNKPSAGVKRVVYVLVIPVLVISCLVFAKLKSDDTGKKTVQQKKKDVSKSKTTKENQAKEASTSKSQLYTRFTLKKRGKSYDEVRINTNGGGWASANIPVNGKVGFLIKNKLYSENDFKKLSARIKDSLYNTSASGATERSSFDILYKLGCRDNLGSYDAILSFLDDAQVRKENKILAQYRDSKKAALPPKPNQSYPPPIVHQDNISQQGGVNYATQTGTALIYLNNNNAAALDKYLASIDDKTQLFNALNEVAWTSALRGENLEWAAQLSKQSIDVVNDLYEHPVSGRYGTAEQTKEAMKGYTFMVGDTYAYILYKQGKYAQALKVQQPLYDRTAPKGGGPVAVHYAQILIANNNYIKAKEVAETGMKSDNASMELEPVLKQCYVKINGSDNGYDEYLAGLKVTANEKLRKKWEIMMMEQQVQKKAAEQSPVNRSPTARFFKHYSDTTQFNAKIFPVDPKGPLGKLLKSQGTKVNANGSVSHTTGFSFP